jgi:protocatechuate 3,4-dioxygenase beta subunit
MTRSNAVSRRDALAVLAVTAAGGVLMSRAAFAQQAGAAGDAPLITGADVCVITSEVTEGPYYFDPALERIDITEGRPGLPTTVRLQVVDGTCRPISGARVDVWHCDATGLYSGYAQPGGISTEGETFMRGTQFAGEDGIVAFETVYPGWYRGRTTHIHFKVFLSDTVALTGQIFFPDDVSESVYAAVAPYNERSEARDTFNDGDRIAQQATEASVATIEQGSDGYLAQLIIGVSA